ADGAHKPKGILNLINSLLNGADIVAGSRFLGQSNDHTSKLHIIGNHFINILIMILTRKKITDSQTGLRAFKGEFLKKVCLESKGYEIETEITVKGLKNGFKFQEIPINCNRRKYSFSKLRILPDAFKIFKTILKSAAKGSY
ncbi:MAG: glycosyltransferase family 2 protein, partial [Candidatus Bathyarchaeia archaeon]